MRPRAGVAVRTERLVLRPMRREDKDEWVALHEASAGEFLAVVVDGREISNDELFERELARSEAEEPAGGMCKRLATLADTGQIVGVVTLSQIFRGTFESCYMGWRIGTPFTRRGLGAEAVTGLLDLAFAPMPEGLGLARVQANIMPANAPSLRLAEKAGFRREGYALRYLQIGGRREDHVMLAKLADEHQRVSTLAQWYTAGK